MKTCVTLKSEMTKKSTAWVLIVPEMNLKYTAIDPSVDQVKNLSC